MCSRAIWIRFARMPGGEDDGRAILGPADPLAAGEPATGEWLASGESLAPISLNSVVCRSSSAHPRLAMIVPAGSFQPDVF